MDENPSPDSSGIACRGGILLLVIDCLPASIQADSRKWLQNYIGNAVNNILIVNFIDFLVIVN